jgi:hypothetical protein
LRITGHRSVRLGSAGCLTLSPWALSFPGPARCTSSSRRSFPPSSRSCQLWVTSLPGDRLTRVPPPPLRRCPVRLLPSSDSLPKQKTVSGSSLGVPQRPPLHRHPRVRPLLGCPRVQGCHTLNSFRPCRSSRLRRFPPHTASQVCCTLQPVMGFAWFRAEGRH